MYKLGYMTLNTMNDFSDLSKELTKVLDKNEKKDNGIFFTPKTYRKFLLDRVKNNLQKKPKKILEPSFGSGEFIQDTKTLFPDATIHGIEKNKTMYKKVLDIYEDYRNVRLFNEDFLKYEFETKYDLIIGNPPYVVYKTKDVPKEFKQITQGRPNLYCWFVYKSINLLADDGMLAFVLPSSIQNTSYYALLRHFIQSTCEILDLFPFSQTKSLFTETEQATIGFIIRKHTGSKNHKFIVSHKDKILFNVHYEFINSELSKYPCLGDLGIKVKTGSVVWNQHKDKLTDDASEGTLLIYSSNIKHGEFINLPVQARNNKKQFIKIKKEKLQGPLILMNRGYGNANYTMNLLYINDRVFDKQEFYAENHLNVIYPTTEDAKELLYKVYEYLNSLKNKKYIQMFTGNNAMSATEIETLIPIQLE